MKTATTRYFLCLWCYSEYISTPGNLKNQPDHGGNRTRDLWFASPILCQLSFEVKSVREFDISELNLAPSISVCFYFIIMIFCGVHVLRCRMCLWCYSGCISTPGKLKNHWTSKPKLAGSIPTVVRFLLSLYAIDVFMSTAYTSLSQLSKTSIN